MGVLDRDATDLEKSIVRDGLNNKIVKIECGNVDIDMFKGLPVEYCITRVLSDFDDKQGNNFDAISYFFTHPGGFAHIVVKLYEKLDEPLSHNSEDIKSKDVMYIAKFKRVGYDYVLEEYKSDIKMEVMNDIETIVLIESCKKFLKVVGDDWGWETQEIWRHVFNRQYEIYDLAKINRPWFDRYYNNIPEKDWTPEESERMMDEYKEKARLAAIEEAKNPPKSKLRIYLEAKALAESKNKLSTSEPNQDSEISEE